MANRIINRLDEQGYMFSQETPYTICLIGRPADNIHFRHGVAYESANWYAKFGYFSTEAGNYRRTWMGVLEEYCGTWINLAAEDVYNEIKTSEMIKGMPCFPIEGSIVEVDNVVIVKISNIY